MHKVSIYNWHWLIDFQRERAILLGGVLMGIITLTGTPRKDVK